jgi:16S rRNA (uracil1498-N3)-methyltransferase
VPSYFIAPDMRSGDRVTVTGPLYAHLAGSLRVRPGESLTLVDGARVLSATVERLGDGALEARVTRDVPAPPEPPAPTLAVGHPKGRKLEEIVRHAVELGVGRIRPVHTARAVPRPKGREGRAGRLEAIALEAAQQSGRTRVPQVDPPVSWADFLADPGTGLRLVLWEGERGRDLLDALLEARGAHGAPEVTLFVGPEGGLTEAEVAALRQRGYASVRLGAHVMRTETACLAALAVAAAALRPREAAALTGQGQGL